MFFGQFARMMLVVFAIALLGAGCRKEITSAPPGAGADTVVPDGWQIVRGKALSIAYPPIWYAKVDTIEQPTPPDLERIFFDPEPIPDGLETEPVYLVMLEVWSGTVEEVLKRYPVATQETVTIGGREVVRFTYGAEFFGDTQPVAYVFGSSGKVYLLQRLDGNPEYIEAMVASMEVR